MNSCVEDILGFKTCCGLKMFDGNLEILVTNSGDGEIVVPSFFDLEMESGTKRVEAIMPQGNHKLQPGETMAFYTQMDETVWSAALRVIFYDTVGNRYSTEIGKECDAALNTGTL
jgi:hypothetical protein